MIKATGWTWQEYQDAPAGRVDWFLAVEDAVDTARRNAESRGAAKTPRARRP